MVLVVDALSEIIKDPPPGNMMALGVTRLTAQLSNFCFVPFAAQQAASSRSAAIGGTHFAISVMRSGSDSDAKGILKNRFLTLSPSMVLLK